MRFFIRNSEEESELERALQGVFFSSSSVLYDGSAESSEKGSPVYVIPVDFHQGVAFGKLKIGKKAEEVAIGLILSNKHYRQHLSGHFVEENSEDRGTLYLPLEQTRMLQRGRSGLSRVLGIKGPHGLHPLLLASGARYTGLLLESGKLVPYNFQLPEEMRMQMDAYMKEEDIQESYLEWEDPKAIISYLDEYVIGQHEAKKIVAIAFSSYMTKVRTKNDRLLKTNILLIGSSGVGKSYMFRLLAKRAKLPIVQTTATGKSTEGHKGENTSSIFEGIRQKTKDYDPYGVIFIDEIDKLAGYDREHGFGQNIQDELIAWFEEAELMDSAASRYGVLGRSMINTRNLLFVTAGAFLGSQYTASLAEITAKRIGSGYRRIGFGVDDKKEEEAVLMNVTMEDIVKYGLKTEFIGRLPCIGVLNSLTMEDKVSILTNVKSSPLEHYVQLLNLRGYDLKIDPDVLKLIAERCPEETGARALGAVCFDLFTEILLKPEEYAKDRTIQITAGLAEDLITLYAKAQ